MAYHADNLIAMTYAYGTSDALTVTLDYDDHGNLTALYLPGNPAGGPTSAAGGLD